MIKYILQSEIFVSSGGGDDDDDDDDAPLSSYDGVTTQKNNIVKIFLNFFFRL
jgi:hypothetical protein